VYLLVRAGGITQWIVHDRTANMAAVVEADAVRRVGPEQRHRLDDLVRVLRDSETHDDVSVHVAGVTVPEPLTSAWRPEYHLVPLTGVMVNGGDLDPTIDQF